MEPTNRVRHVIARQMAGEGGTLHVLDGFGATSRLERDMVRSVDILRPRPAMLFRGDRRTWLVLRDLLWCAAILALWITLWMSGAATLTQPWGPDPETRAALRDRAPTAVAVGGDAPGGR